VRAVILAAGEGTRLRPHTLERPKCLVELGGASLLSIQLGVLRSAGISDVHVVTGYRADQIVELGHPTVHNPEYAHSNMVASLMCGAALLDGGDDVVIAYGDIVYEPRVIEALCACDAPLATTVDTSWQELWAARNEDPLTDAETLRLDASGHILELGRKPRSLEEIEGQYMGLVKARADFAPELVRVWESLDPAARYDGRDRANMYMTSFLQHLIDHGRPLRAVPVAGGWLEVDTAGDLALYECMLEGGRLNELCRIGPMEGS
jgi:choline kinase